MDQLQEQSYLEKVEGVLSERIGKLEAHLHATKADILSSKQDLWQNFYELDPEEIAATNVMIENDIIQHDDNQRTLFVLYRQAKSPYFGRIDFCRGSMTMPCYIGIAHLVDTNSPKILTFDWRAPLSSMYYNNELGPASFEAPSGTIQGEITGKYQYKIVDGKMQYMFDSSITVQDEILQIELSNNASDKMKNIVATIQKEQNTIIRADAEKTFLVQGAAGSGKTSIALHRIAYLLYQRRDTLKSSNVLIISPSRMFSNYIAGVLPELGEESIIEMSFSDLAKNELGKGMKLEPRFSYIEKCLSGGLPADKAETVEFKASAQFPLLLRGYVANRAIEIYNPEDITIAAFEMEKAKLLDLYCSAYPRLSPVEKIIELENMIKERLFDTLGTKELKKAALEEVEQILGSFRSFGSLIDEYNLFLAELNRKGYPAGGPIGKEVPFEDVYPLLLFKTLFFGKPEYRFVKHLLVDEMQDYTPVQYEILNSFFTCPKTILGDIEQAVDPYTNIRSLETLRGLFGENGIYLEMNTSYRSTYEITEVAKSIINSTKYEAVARHGTKPRIYKCGDSDRQNREISDAIGQLLENGFSSIAVMCKTRAEALSLWEGIGTSCDVKLLVNPDENYNQGVVITTCYIAKGLEFDCVLIPNCTKDYYGSPLDRKPLYVSSTRALHELKFFSPDDSVAEYLLPALSKGLIEE